MFYYNKNNLILRSDSYKFSHAPLFKPGTNSTFYYIEARGGSYDEIVFFGLQYYLKEYLTTPITQDNIEEAEQFCMAHGVPFNRKGWQHILDKHNGFLPLRIRAVPEGTAVTVKNVLMTVETIDPECYWLAGFMETLLLKVWYPTTVASRSRYMYKLIKNGLDQSSDNPDAGIDFKLLSFGYRGVSSEESALIAGCAELLYFRGTDTIAGVLGANNYYDEPMAGFSTTATEHSVLCSFGKDGELEAYKNLLQTYAKPGTIVACVSDTYDLWNCIKNYWCGELKQTIIDSGATFVCRLDSGDPLEVVPKALDMLAEGFGYTVNNKGYKVLNHNIKVLQGDGIDEHSIKKIIDIVLDNRFSLDNVVFGCGGGMIQKLDRDTCRFAEKLSSLQINGEEFAVCKDPLTDPGKKSKAGRLDLLKINGYFKTIVLKNGDIADYMTAMQTVFENGKLLINDNLGSIRQRTGIK